MISRHLLIAIIPLSAWLENVPLPEIATALRQAPLSTDYAILLKETPEAELQSRELVQSEPPISSEEVLVRAHLLEMLERSARHVTPRLPIVLQKDSEMITPRVVPEEWKPGVVFLTPREVRMFMRAFGCVSYWYVALISTKPDALEITVGWDVNCTDGHPMAGTGETRYYQLIDQKWEWVDTGFYDI